MEKAIRIGDKELRLSNNVGWALIYRNQFGKDIVQAIMPALTGVLDVAGGLIRESGVDFAKSEKLTVEAFANVVGSDSYYEAIAHLSMLELTDLIHITWAMNKCADSSVPNPESWASGLESFPLDEIVPVLFSLLVTGFMSTKNSERLQKVMTDLKSLRQTPSSSPDSNED